MNNNFYGMNNDVPSITGLKLNEHMWWLFGLTVARLICMLPSMNGDSLNSTLTNIILSVVVVITAVRLFKLSSYEYEYRKSAVWLVAYCVFEFIFTVAGVIFLSIIDTDNPSGGIVIILIGAVIIESFISNTLKAVSVYYCCKAHKELIGTEDYSLCEKWNIYSIAYIASAAATVLVNVIYLLINTTESLTPIVNAITVLISVSLLIFECVLLVLTANHCRKMK